MMQLKPGGRYGLRGGGWPPATIVRDQEGRYFIQRLTSDLKDVHSEEITEENALDWIDADRDQD